jgi:hypothetical protein
MMYIIRRMKPEFPEFKPITLDDRDVIHRMLWQYQPDTSELTFTNLFIWRAHYGFLWSVYRDWLLIVGGNSENGVQAMPPIGPSSRVEVTAMLLQWLKENRDIPRPHIDRADRRLVSELQASPNFLCEPVRDHYDYVYKTTDLIELAGKGYRQQRNHTNYLLRTYKMTYEPMNESHVDSCLNLARSWCEARQCEEDLSFASEGEATREALQNFRALGLDGGVILINGRVEAFTLGELLNRDTAVVHIEKANVEIRGLYAAINQQFCEKRWRNVPAVNREQDLGEPGLRKAKLSYNPDHMVEKFRAGLLT